MTEFLCLHRTKQNSSHWDLNWLQGPHRAMALAPGEPQQLQDRWQPWRLKALCRALQFGWAFCATHGVGEQLSSIHFLFNSTDSWASHPGRWPSQWRQMIMHWLLPSRSFMCANHGPDWVSFPPRREGLPLLSEQPAGLVMKEMAQQYSSYLAAGCWGFKIWPPVDYFPKHRRESYAWIISWQTLALAGEIKGEDI